MEINIHVKEAIEKAKYDQIPMCLRVPLAFRMNDERIKSIAEAMINEVNADVKVTDVEKDKNDPETFHIMTLSRGIKRWQKKIVSSF
jgi:hypothetical protein